MPKLKGQQCGNIDTRVTSNNCQLLHLLNSKFVPETSQGTGAGQGPAGAGAGAGAGGEEGQRLLMRNQQQQQQQHQHHQHGFSTPTLSTTDATSAAANARVASTGQGYANASASQPQLRPWVQLAFYPDTFPRPEYDVCPHNDVEYEDVPRGASFDSWTPADIVVAN